MISAASAQDNSLLSNSVLAFFLEGPASAGSLASSSTLLAFRLAVELDEVAVGLVRWILVLASATLGLAGPGGVGRGDLILIPAMLC